MSRSDEIKVLKVEFDKVKSLEHSFWLESRKRLDALERELHSRLREVTRQFTDAIQLASKQYKEKFATMARMARDRMRQVEQEQDKELTQVRGSQKLLFSEVERSMDAAKAQLEVEFKGKRDAEEAALSVSLAPLQERQRELNAKLAKLSGKDAQATPRETLVPESMPMQEPKKVS